MNTAGERTGTERESGRKGEDGGGGLRRDVERGRDKEMKWDEMRNMEQRSFTIIAATQQ